LENLNEKRNLYNNDIFQGNIAFMFLNTFFSTLLQKSHNLLREDLIAAVYHIASNSFLRFFNEFLPFFLARAQFLSPQQKTDLLQSFGRDVDSPSFARNMNQFINDYCYYQQIFV